MALHRPHHRQRRFQQRDDAGAEFQEQRAHGGAGLLQRPGQISAVRKELLTATQQHATRMALGLAQGLQQRAGDLGGQGVRHAAGQANAHAIVGHFGNHHGRGPGCGEELSTAMIEQAVNGSQHRHVGTGGFRRKRRRVIVAPSIDMRIALP